VGSWSVGWHVIPPKLSGPPKVGVAAAVVRRESYLRGRETFLLLPQSLPPGD
jgi:hypothetical protein